MLITKLQTIELLEFVTCKNVPSLRKESKDINNQVYLSNTNVAQNWLTVWQKHPVLTA